MMSNPSIVIGFGDYGLSVIRKLLLDSAIQGMLDWSEKTSMSNSRSILGVRFFHFYRSGHNTENTEEAFGDLYGQITHHSLGDWLKNKDEVMASVKEASDSLLRIGVGVTKGGVTQMLDVFAIANPDENGFSIDALDAYMDPIIIRLNQLAPFQLDAGTALINYIEFLDYQDISSRLPETLSKSRELHASVVKWERRRRQSGQANKGYGRIYLSDGSTRAGIIDSIERQLQLVAFLQLLLFEEIEPEVRRPWVYREIQAPILSSFGISVAEYGIESLSRSAAARFLSRRYEYLAGNDSPSHFDSEHSPLHIQEQIHRVDVDNLVGRFGVDYLNSTLVGSLEEIRKDLTEKFEELVLESNIDDQRIQILLNDLDLQYSRTEVQLADKVLEKLAEFRSKTIAKHREEMEAAIAADLSAPIPIGLIIEQLEEASNHIAEKRESIRKKYFQRNKRSTLKSIAYSFSKYLLFNSQRLNLEKNRWVWALFSIVCCIGVTPVFFEYIRIIPNIWQSASVFNEPLFTDYIFEYPAFSFVFLLMTLGVSTYYSGVNYVSRALAQAFSWFLNPQRGSIHSVLNNISRNQNPVVQLGLDIKDSLSAEVMQMLDEVTQLLKRRQSEARWLTTQLRIMKDRIPVRKSGSLEMINRTVYQILDEKALITMENFLPAQQAVIERQGEADGIPSLFEAWGEKYNNRLLRPIPYIDEMSNYYRDKFVGLSDTGGEKSEQMEHYVDTVSNHFTANFVGPEGDQRYAFIGSQFTSEELKSLLASQLTIRDIHSLDKRGKIYLLAISSGLDSKSTRVMG